MIWKVLLKLQMKWVWSLSEKQKRLLSLICAQNSVVQIQFNLFSSVAVHNNRHKIIVNFSHYWVVISPCFFLRVISSIVYHILTGTLDMKHLPHRVAMFYRQLSQSFSSLLLSMCDTEAVTTSVTDTVLSQVNTKTTINTIDTKILARKSFHIFGFSM